MSDGLIHKLGWKVGTSRGTSCGLQWDSPAMLSLVGKPVDPALRNCPFYATQDGARVTCPKCREKVDAEVDDVLMKPDTVSF